MRTLEDQNGRKMLRVAIFMDYENFFNSLKKLNQTLKNVYGYAPKMDFQAFVDAVEREYGVVQPEDFIVVANFTHYDGQKGGLNQVATLIDVDSFEDRATRSELQNSPGKKYVIDNYADARLAYEMGIHFASRPADIYIIASGDKFFMAPAEALQASGANVYFLVTDSAKTAISIKRQFHTILFSDMQPDLKMNKPKPEIKETVVEQSAEEDTVEHYCVILTKLRRDLHSGIPSTLILSFFEAERAKKLMNKAQGEGKVDFWESDIGVQCVSLQEERLFNTVQKMGIREGLSEKSELLYLLRIAEAQNEKMETLADWRKGLLQLTDYSSREVKKWLQRLQDAGILLHYDYKKVDMSYEKVIKFIES